MKEKGIDNLQNQLNIFSSSKAVELTEPLWNFQDEIVSRLMRSYSDNRDLHRISLYDKDGKLLALTLGTSDLPHSTILTVQRDITRNLGDETIRLGRLIVEYHDGHILAELHHRRQSDTILMLALILVLSGTIWLLVHFMVGKPLHHLKQSLNHNATRKDRTPLTWKSGDEIGEVVAAYNTLLREVEQQTEKLVGINRTLYSEISQRMQAEARLAKAHSDLEHKVALRTMELHQANEDLRELDMQRSAFLSSASHELRTPLAAVLGFAVLIRKNFDRFFLPHADSLNLRDKSETIRSNLDIIAKEGDRLTRLIDDLLDLNKIEAGHMEWRDTQLNVPDEISRCVKTMKSTFDKKPELHLQVMAEEILPALDFDPDRFQQLLINLLSNAVKHTLHGSITVEAIRVDDTLRIRVHDTGKGIPDDDLKFIFHRFYQSRNGDTDKPSGTGLGLPICKTIVEHYGGTLVVESRLGKGSTFTVRLPLSRKDARSSTELSDCRRQA